MSQLNGPGRNRRFVPTDLIVTALFGIWMFVPTTLGFWSPARMAVGLLAVFLIPGYALVSALFPIQGPTDKSEDSTWFGTD
jgi:uncharacterized membrane protein